MKHSIFTIFAFTILLAVSCSKDDAPTDARLPFVGQFQAHEHVVTYESVLTRTQRTVSAGTEIEARLVQSSTNQIEMDLDSLMKNIFLEFTMEIITIDFDTIPKAIISGNSFELPPTPFEVVLGDPATQPIHESNIKGMGTLQGKTILFDYQISYDGHGVMVTFTGEVELVKGG